MGGQMDSFSANGRASDLDMDVTRSLQHSRSILTRNANGQCIFVSFMPRHC